MLVYFGEEAGDLNGEVLWAQDRLKTLAAQYPDSVALYLSEMLTPDFFGSDDPEWASLKLSAFNQYIDQIAFPEGRPIPSQGQLQVVPLHEGINNVTLYVHPPDPSLPVLFGSMVADSTLRKVFHDDGTRFWPEEDTQYSLSSWDYKKGYFVWMHEADTLRVTGPVVNPEEVVVPIPSGQWWIVPYPHTAPMPVETAWEGILDNLELAVDEAGNQYYPSRNQYAFTQLEPGKAYRVQLNAPDTLAYGSGGAFAMSAAPLGGLAPDGMLENGAVVPESHFAEPPTGGLISLLIVAVPMLEDGAEVAARTDDGRLVGRAVVRGGRAFLTVWGTDAEATQQGLMLGAAYGEPFTLYGWSPGTGIEAPLSVTSVADALTGASRPDTGLSFAPGAVLDVVAAD